MSKDQKLCRFCLKEINPDGFEIIEQTKWDILSSLNLKINLNISEEPVICESCGESMQKLFNFKETCMETNDCLLLLGNSQSDAKSNLPELYLKLNPNKSLSGENVCRLCMRPIPIQCSTQLNAFIDETLPAKYLLEKCFPEVDFNLVEEPIICEICRKLLGESLIFIKTCISIEENIRIYIEIEGIDGEAKVNLRNVKQFLDNLVIKKEIDDMGFIQCEIQQNHREFLKDPYLKSEIKSEFSPQMNDLNLILKNEEFELKQPKDDSDSILDATEFADIKQENEQFLQRCDIKQTCPSPIPHGCNICGENYNGYLVKQKSYPNKKQNGRSSEHRTQFNCSCRPNRKRNNPSRVKLRKCENENCSYETRRKSDLERHGLIHRNPSEIEMFRCEYANCLFETKHKYSLNKHMLIHKSCSEVRIYKCDYPNCFYQTKFRYHLTSHLLIHKIATETTAYRCINEECSYETRRKSDLKKHMLIHKNLSEVRIYTCDYENCLFKSRYKYSLSKHVLLHKSPLEVTMYKCRNEDCSYATKFKSHILGHLLIHKNPSEITMYKCDIESCAYEAKRKTDLQKHLLVHRSPTEINMHRCTYENCGFQTKHLKSFLNHVLIHKNSSEVTMYKCENKDCSYETKVKSRLVSHKLVHKDSTELTMYKCGYDGCSFETKHKRALKTHMVTHRNPSDVRMYKCQYEKCIFETKHKKSFTRHVLIHK